MLNKYGVSAQNSGIRILRIDRLDRLIYPEHAMQLAAHLVCIAQALSNDMLQPFDDYLYAVENDLDEPTQRPASAMIEKAPELQAFYVYVDPFTVSVQTEEAFTEAGGKSLAWGLNWRRVRAYSEEDAARIARQQQPATDHDKPIHRAFEEFDLSKLDVNAKPFPAVAVACDELDLMSVSSVMFRIANPDDSLKDRAPYYGTWYANGICSVITEEQFSGQITTNIDDWLPIYAQNFDEASRIIRQWSLAAYDVQYGPIEYLAQFYQRSIVGRGARPPGKPTPMV